MTEMKNSIIPLTAAVKSLWPMVGCGEDGVEAAEWRHPLLAAQRMYLFCCCDWRYHISHYLLETAHCQIITVHCHHSLLPVLIGIYS